jgi:glutathione S-transferase
LNPTVIGRSSSHFTRVTRIFAAELGVDCDLEVVRDLLARDAAAFGGNPALKIPSLRVEGVDGAVWFGALPVCRELWRRSGMRARVLWPEDLDEPLAANAQELVVQAMSTEVSLILSKAGGATETAHTEKMRESLLGSMAWLEANVPAALATLPERDLAYLEVTLFCLIEHLAFRDVVPVEPYARLESFRRSFASRPSAQATGYRFDA